jgi:hypothetical protein
VVDLKRRAEVSRAANERYLTALAATSGKVPLFQWVESVCKPAQRDGRRARALNPWSPADSGFSETFSLALLRSATSQVFKLSSNAT